MERIALYYEVFEKYYRMVHYRINSMLSDPDASDDLTQETFTRLVEHIDHLNDINHIRKWLLTVATNLTLDYIAKHSRVSLYADTNELFGDNAPTIQPDTVQDMMAAELLRDVFHYIESWDDRSQMIFLSRLNGRTSREIAKELGCSTGSVESKFQRLRGRIESKFANQWRDLYHEK